MGYKNGNDQSSSSRLDVNNAVIERRKRYKEVHDAARSEKSTEWWCMRYELSRRFPEIYAEVKAKKLSVNAAAIKAGLRRARPTHADIENLEQYGRQCHAEQHETDMIILKDMLKRRNLSGVFRLIRELCPQLVSIKEIGRHWPGLPYEDCLLLDISSDLNQHVHDYEMQLPYDAWRKRCPL